MPTPASDRLRRFSRDTRGSIGLYMAIAILPIALLIGAATDFRRLDSLSRLVQEASDAAVLAAARAYAAGGDDGAARLAAAQKAASGSLEGNLVADRDKLAALSWTVMLDPERPGELKLVTNGRIPLAFAGLFGLDQVPFSVSSSATAAAMKNLEVALVLDNTGSMGQLNKIGILRDATIGLIRQLEGATAANPDRANALKIALVPFSMSVRLDDPAAYAGADWMTGTPTHASYDGLLAAGVDRFQHHVAHGGWKGCVESRPSDGGLDVGIDNITGGGRYAPFTNAAHPDYNPGGDPNAGCGVLPMLRLTNDAAAVKAAAAAMTADGNTNIPLGLIWGWNAVAPSGHGPFGDGVAYRQEKSVKSVVLMTDGQNHIGTGPLPDGGPYSGLGLPRQGRIDGVSVSNDVAARAAALNARLSRICEAMKAEGIVLYTVRLVDGPVETLSACASEGRFFDVQRPEDLPGVFSRIAGDILALRLAR